MSKERLLVRSKKEIQLLEKLEAAAQLHGYDLVDIERTGSGRNSLLRVFVSKEDGLTLDDVAAANKWVNEVVEALDPYKESYTLEVSSPGIDRPLRTLQHFAQAVGEEAVISLDAAAAAHAGSQEEKGDKVRLKYTGVIKQVDASKQLITLACEDKNYDVNYTHIKKARIKGRFDFEGRKDS